LLQDGDIVVSRAGSIGVSHLVRHPQGSVFASYLIRFKPLIDNSFVAFFLKSPDYWRAISESSSGIAMLNVNAKKLQQIQLPLPPLNEQRRIVERIEELFAKLDAGVKSLKQAQALLKRYRQAVLKAAVEGELSREWREVHKDELEPASELLERALQARREMFGGKKYKQPPVPDTAGLPKLPQGWCWTSLSSVADMQLGKMLSQAAKTGNKSRPYLRNQNERWGSIDTSDVLMMDFDEREVEKFTMLRGDVLVCEGGEPGRAAVWNEQLPGAMYQKALHRVRVIGGALVPEYLVYHLRKDASEGALERYFTGSTIKHFTGVALAKYAVSLPPLEEQRFLVEEVERRLSVVDKLEATIEENLKQAGALRQSILRRAFSGELVPQDPNDEPASVLLERIREERQATKPKGRRERKGKTGSTRREHAEQGGLF
jgi:type I restriction enzyme S subunit